ncbi:hypothetical protein SteCoe_24129 [Stentor coeruleus]|uniref:Uncharacterized protein n=1 Tax=Stentor coeruleus TaxID=5963 RepID=A0A1R2BI92_9CILI|nr:hypothetical protein SteCoe_24129 [Stentor coeruleus]
MHSETRHNREATQIVLKGSFRKTRRTKTQPSQLNNFLLKESVVKVIEETSEARQELAKLRTDLQASKEFFEKEQTCKTLSKEFQVVSMIKSLQTEMKDLNEIINATHEKIYEKDLENQTLKDSISKFNIAFEEGRSTGCGCIII